MAKIALSVFVAVVVLGLAQADVITSPEVTNWGEWADDFQRCPTGSFAQGFQLLVELPKGPVDDTSANGIRLFCGDPISPVTPSITSNFGAWGEWRNVHSCPNGGHITGFQAQVEIPDAFQDETATNNIKVFCSTTTTPIEGDGGPFGQWGVEQKCPQGQAVTGIRTQIQADQGDLQDDTSLNNFAFECSPVA